MSDYTMEELQQMMDEKMQEEIISASMPTNEETQELEIGGSNDMIEYVLRDDDKFNKIIYCYKQSATIGKRITYWMKYKPVVENGVITTYVRTQISQSFSTDLNENYSQTELIIEE